MSGSPPILKFAQVRESMDVHRELARALNLPEYYGHNWDAFWDCITSDYPLPDRLVVEGLDYLELALPREAEQLLQCLCEYNNSEYGSCQVETTDDYARTIVFVLVEAVPKRLESGSARGAMVSAWLKRPDPAIAEADAFRDIEKAGWTVVKVEEARRVDISHYPEGAEGREFFKQACVDGQTYVFNTWDCDGEG